MHLTGAIRAYVWGCFTGLGLPFVTKYEPPLEWLRMRLWTIPLLRRGRFDVTATDWRSGSCDYPSTQCVEVRPLNDENSVRVLSVAKSRA